MDVTFDMTCIGKDRLTMAMQIMFYSEPHRPRPVRATHYQITTERGLVFYDYSFELSGVPQAEQYKDKIPTDLTAMPFKLDAEGAADFALRWLDEAEYPREPDTDGSTEKGWRVHNGQWGHPHSDNWSSFVAVKPDWIVYGK